MRREQDSTGSALAEEKVRRQAARIDQRRQGVHPARAVGEDVVQYDDDRGPAIGQFVDQNH